MRLAHLDSLLKAVGGTSRILILPHNDPDPDAIASALALRHLLMDRLGVEGHIVYKGIIGRAENKALVRYLGHPLRRLTARDLCQAVPVALIDTQPGAGNHALPANSAVAIVLDHHTWRETTVTAGFFDVRQDVGATSTILTEYLQAAGLEPAPPLATALFYGIKTDTMGLSRGASAADVAAYFYLHSLIDVYALADIERAQVPAEYFERLVATLQAARVYDSIVISYIGSMSHPDLTSEMADLLLRLEGTQWTICMGAYKEELILSARTRNHQGGAGGLAQKIVGERGSAGGHGTMAGGQIPLHGKEPETMVRELSRLALQYLKMPSDMRGKSLL
jgi:nanoRNase/pAp phosphatase (c-di-AMP/oligoRNAs hydrolase)